MAEKLARLSIIFFIFAAICFAIAVFIWIYFKIPSVISDLSGRTARKSIAKMRTVNEQSKKIMPEKGSSHGRPDSVSSNTNQASENPLEGTEKLRSEGTARIGSEGTAQLESERTEKLRSEGTERLGATELLVDENVTAPLNNKMRKQPAKRESHVKFQMIEEVMLIHTDEVIECKISSPY